MQLPAARPRRTWSTRSTKMPGVTIALADPCSPSSAHVLRLHDGQLRRHGHHRVEVPPDCCGRSGCPSGRLPRPPPAPRRRAARAPSRRCGRRTRASPCPAASLVPTAVAVKKARHAGAGGAHAARPACPAGTISSSILPARYSSSNTTEPDAAREGADDLADAARAPSAAPGRMRPAPALLATTVRSVAPCSISPSISALGWPDRAEAADQHGAPSLTPSMASAMSRTILSIMSVSLPNACGARSRHRGSAPRWPPCRPARAPARLPAPRRRPRARWRRRR